MFVMKKQLSANYVMLLSFLTIQSPTILEKREQHVMVASGHQISFAQTHIHERSAIMPLFFPLVIFQEASHGIVSTLYSSSYSVPIIALCPEF